MINEDFDSTIRLTFTSLVDWGNAALAETISSSLTPDAQLVNIEYL